MITSFHHTRSDFKIFWNVRNDIDFLIKDFDRQTQSIPSTRSFEIVISNVRSGVVLMRKALTIMSAPRGHMRLSLSVEEALSLPIGHLSYCVLSIEDGEETLLYTDRDHGPSARLEVTYGPVPEATQPLTIERAAFLPVNGALVSGAHKGPAQIGGNGVQTIQITGNDYTGVLTIEGSLEEAPPTTEQEWFEIDTLESDQLNGNASIDLNVMINWIRFSLVEHNGTLSRLIYRA